MQSSWRSAAFAIKAVAYDQLDNVQLYQFDSRTETVHQYFFQNVESLFHQFHREEEDSISVQSMGRTWAFIEALIRASQRHLNAIFPRSKMTALERKFPSPRLTMSASMTFEDAVQWAHNDFYNTCVRPIVVSELTNDNKLRLLGTQLVKEMMTTQGSYSGEQTPFHIWMAYLKGCVWWEGLMIVQGLKNKSEEEREAILEDMRAAAPSTEE